MRPTILASLPPRASHWSEEIAGIAVRWAGDQPLARVFVDLPPGDYEVTLAMQAFAESRRISLKVNGELLATDAIVSEDSLAAYTFTLPAGLIGDGQHTRVALQYDTALVPAEIDHSADQRQLAVMVDWIEFRRVSP